MKSNSAKSVLILTVVFIFSLLTITNAQAALGDLDPSFGNGGKVISTDFGGNARAIQSDGKIVAAGVVFPPTGAFVFSVSRYNADGSLDATFGSGGRVITPIGNLGYPFATTVAIQPDGKIIVGGSNDLYGDSTHNFLLARYETDGSLDTTFGVGGKVVTPFNVNGEAGLTDIAIQSDGKIVAVGNSGGYYTNSDFLLARYNNNGSLDTSFGSGGIVENAFGSGSYTRDAAIQPDGKIVAVGTSGDAFALARYNANGSLDASFGTGGKVLTTFDGSTLAEAVQIQTDGKILAVGRSYATSYYFALSRYTTNGSLDASFGSGGTVLTQTGGNFNVANTVKIQSDGKIVVGGDYSNQGNFAGRFALVRYQGRASLTVANTEELYAAVNNPQNAGTQIFMAPGVYMLSVDAPNGAARPNGGRLELQENMSLQGAIGDRSSVVIDAINLPASSYSDPSIGRTGAVRMGRGTNSIEWLTVRNAVNGPANIETDLVSTGTAYIRIAHIASSGSERGIDVRNVGATMAGRVIEAEIVDNDLLNNTIGFFGQGLRIVNNAGADGGVISVTLSDNRIRNNYIGLIVENNGSSLARISISSSRDRFDENGLGALVGAGLSAGNFANGNTVTFTAQETSFQNNNGTSNFDRGGLVIVGGENVAFPNGTSDNTVNVVLRGCRLGNNQLYDLAAFGARSNPESIGSPGTNNRVKVRLYGTYVPVLVTADSIPATPGGMNSVTIIRNPLMFDYDGDGRTDLSVFRPSDRSWYLNRSQAGLSATQFGLATDKITPADFDGDGKTDIAVYRPSQGVWYISNSATPTNTVAQFGIAEDLPAPGDYDGDGKADIAVFRPSTGVWWINRSTAGLTAVQFGVSGDIPAPGDYDGDGKTDLVVYRPSNGSWYQRRSTGRDFALRFGDPTDRVAPADYDGDGKFDVAVYRPSQGAWYIANIAGVSQTVIVFGQPTDIPVPGDYDGDGKADIAIFRPSTGQWWLNRTTSGLAVTQFGLNGDRPTSNAFGN